VSVINKVLRDLDARRANSALPELQRQAGPDTLLGTFSVGRPGQGSTAPRRVWWLVAVLLLAVIGLGAWYVLDDAVEGGGRTAPPGVVVAMPAAPTPAPVASEPPGPAASAAAETGPAPRPASSAPLAIAPPAAESRQAADAPAPDTRKKRPHARTPAREPPARALPAADEQERQRRQPAGAERERRAVAAPAPATMLPPAAAVAAASAPAGDAASPAQRRQALARETLAQAQALWAAGSSEAAVDLVREAVQLSQRSQPVDAAVLATLVREQVRMELVLGRPAAVLELLTRLEPVLSDQADLWAVRGNAAQRLGRHQESVRAYLAALQLRPGEPRWMLGAAVSLAAQGQLDAAAQQVEQARAFGPVSPEVLNYLRQAGVPLR
jgi:MSHA biogenesis protein MshN